MTRRYSDSTNAARRSGPRRSSVWGEVLPRPFYERDVVTVARALLGTVVVHETADGVAAGRVVETEAYDGRDDAASHAWRGERPHLRQLFGPPSTIYVYRSYGVHWCANAVTAPEGKGSAVLLRAVEPVHGLPLMRRRRGAWPDSRLANGPGKLCGALGITGAQDGGTWWSGPLVLCEGHHIAAEDIGVTVRIGITRAAERPMRFIVRSSAALSRRAP